MDQKFSTGDRVRLKVGGPVMIVRGINENGDVVCYWFENERPRSLECPESLLDPAERMDSQADADLDELVGVYRRGVFDRDVTERAVASGQLGEPLALIMIDLDKFKSINDSHGHPAGDEVLQSVASSIKKIVGARGTCYRYGGEELSVLLSNYTADEAAALAERIRKRIESSPIGSKALHITASFGVAEAPTHATTSVELLRMADSALYEAKDLGRNLVRISGEPSPSEPGPRVARRREPDSSRITDIEAEKIRADHFRHLRAVCPRDGSVLRIQEFQSDEKNTPDLDISCPFCGLSERLLGVS